MTFETLIHAEATPQARELALHQLVAIGLVPTPLAAWHTDELLVVHEADVLRLIADGVRGQLARVERGLRFLVDGFEVATDFTDSADAIYPIAFLVHGIVVGKFTTLAEMNAAVHTLALASVGDRLTALRGRKT
jgi:hypothetical protein